MVDFIGLRNSYRSELVFPMLPIQSVARLSNSELVFHHNWFPEGKMQSSTWRELNSGCLALEALQIVCPT